MPAAIASLTMAGSSDVARATMATRGKRRRRSRQALRVALEGLAARAPIPVELVVELPHRPTPEVEVAAYYVISEALTNAIKHAAASRVTVHVGTVEDANHGALLVDVVDDGVGGVDPGRGSGLQGLRDRLAALDGRLDVTGPPGMGTTVRAVIPCG